MAETKSLHEKLVEVFREVEYVAKKGKNEAQGYEYQRAADMANAVRAKLFERGILITPSEKDCKIEHMPTLKGGVATEVLLTIDYTVSDGKESFTYTAYGMARANDDKAIWKAKTGAQKYLLRGLGLIPDAKDDPEYERGQDSDAHTAAEHEADFFDPEHHLPTVRVKALTEAFLKNGIGEMAQSKWLGEHKYKNWENVLNKDWEEAKGWAFSKPTVPQNLTEELEQSVGMVSAAKALASAVIGICGICGGQLRPSKEEGGKPYCVPCWKRKKGI